VRRVLPISEELPIHDVAGTRLLEQGAALGLGEHALMLRAGESVARLTLAIAPNAQRIWIAAGPGNNGGDGLQAAIHLLHWGKKVEVGLIGDAGALPVDAQAAFKRAVAAGVQIGSSTSPSDEPDVAIDALLGIGASRAPMGLLAQSIARLNELHCPVLSIDLPSGLNANTGQPLGSACVVASHTLAMLTIKPGMFTAAGRDFVGDIWLDSLGVDALTQTPQAWLSGVTAAEATSPRRHAQHKGSFGDVAVVAGAQGMSGAALLAARAAHAAGAGRVFVQLLDNSAQAATIDLTRPELMFRHDWWQSPAEVLAHTTVACGCGGGQAVRAPLPRLLSLAHRLVVDADALNALSSDTTLAAMLRARASRGLATVLTPHPLEGARLLGVATSEVQSDRLLAAKELASRFDCVVVLKGSGTVICAPGQTPRINSTGNAALATAGTGDVLAGWLAGRWAQRNAHDEVSAAFAAARQAVGEHGAAAEPPPASGPLRAGDLIERLHYR
jgi:ADP-dependent NAD(P)H-hydrate dehydratase / NAD(P)H-hydrate epimerase